ncbi:hypothetical protein FBUS_08473 [Fasciolopsis buskii]|uniref:TATA-binding protein-associated factor n=1 Tax=Fasciolopsis buskii TaxID=27845 RepID=A0A8E0RV15_9TREM|nr:hypothetical protein FBUS_08473 [Fasciolopsis buski]
MQALSFVKFPYSFAVTYLSFIFLFSDSVLTHLFSRICQCTAMDQPNATVHSLVDSNAPETATTSMCILTFFLDQLLCCLHLNERLAMQRFIGGLVLSSWALLPSGPKSEPVWATALENMVPLVSNSSDVQGATTTTTSLPVKLRTRLEACLTEVIYYEEILSLFRLMQEDCRELVRMLQSLGLGEDPVFAFNGVRTIAQCLVMLEKATKQLDDFPGVANETIDPEAYRTAVYKLDRARCTVERCLALQLHWGSRVEFAIASALTNLNCLLPGRLSLLIRPFMDTIRCICPTPSTSDLQSSKNLEMLLTTQMLPTGSNLPLQRLATVCLVRLLRLEWAVHARKQPAGAPNPSKAALKVVKNLATSLLESDPQLHVSIDQNEGKSNSGLNGDPESVSDEVDCSNRLTKVVSSTDLMTTTTDQRIPWQEARYRGSKMAIGYLCQSFLQQNSQSMQSKNDCTATPITVNPLQHLQLGLPGLWSLMWTEPVNRFFTLGDGLIVGPRDSSLRSFLHDGLISQMTGIQLLKSDEEVICTGILTLTTCVPILLPHLGSASEPASTSESIPMTFDQLVYLGVIATCLQSAVIRTLGARLLASLAMERPVETLNILLPLYLDYLEPFEVTATSSSTSTTGGLKRECSEVNPPSTPPTCTGTLEALTAIVEQLSQASFPDSCDQRTPWSGLDQNDPLADPDSVEFRSGDIADAADCTADYGEPKLSRFFTLFLPYIVVLVPPVLRLLADPSSTVRVLASRLFTSLLTLFPLEGSLPDPPGMDPSLCVARATNRQFIDNLLHPNRIQMYNLPIPIQADLRGYQQDGVNWLSFLNRYGLNGILCDDLGLGKTLQTLCILAGSHYELRQKQHSEVAAGCARSLVVCPSTLCGHWLHEVEQFVNPRDLSPIVYTGGPTVRLSLQTQILDHNLVIASYDLVRNDVAFFQSIFWNYIVLDEGHIIKSSKSKVARALKQLCARHRLILTGTPIQNRVCELWSLFDFLMPDFLGSESSFVARFSRPVSASRDPKATRAEQRAGHLALENLHKLVLPFMLRRLKEDVMRDLPPKIIQDFACEMTSIQLMLYEAFMNSNEGRVLLKSINVKREDDDDADSLPVTYGAVRHGFQALRYLQAVCNHPCLALKPTHPILADVKRVLHAEYGARVSLDSVYLSGKLLALCRLLTDCGFGTPNFGPTADLANQFNSSGASTSTGPASFDLDDSSRSLLNQHRALIFFQTREMLRLTEEMLRNQFPWITSTRLDGSVPLNERFARVTRFNSDPSIDLMLLTTAVGGLGLNLTGADTVIFVEHDWNPSKDLQAMDRVHRIGQKRTVNVYRLITEHSIEEQIMNLQAFKLHLASTVVSADNRHLGAMDTAHLFDRFTGSGSQFSSNQHDSRSATCDLGAFESLEECYETEYNLDAFVARLK